MPIVIEKAKAEDITELALLYDELNDYLTGTVNYPGWRKGIYPNEETAREGIEEGSLYVARIEGRIAGSLILRHEQEIAYHTATWQVDATEDELIVIYTFAVHPDYLKHGVGSALMAFVEQFVGERQLKSIRLDVYEKNLPAIRLYEKCGYRYIDTVDLGLGEYGLEHFKLYEKVL